MIVRPRITATSIPFWAALDRDRIELQQCDHCNAWVFYPRTLCPHCGSTTLTWKGVSGRASLYTFTLAITPVSADFADDAPILLAVAELVEGVRLPTTLVDVAAEDVRIGMQLEPVFDHARLGDLTLLRFRPDNRGTRS